MFGLVNVLDVDSEERIRQPSSLRRVRKVDIDDESRESREEQSPSPFATCDKSVVWVDDAVAVLVKVQAVLLHYGLAFVLCGPVAIGGAVRIFIVCSDGSACCAWVYQTVALGWNVRHALDGDRDSVNSYIVRLVDWVVIDPFPQLIIQLPVSWVGIHIAFAGSGYRVTNSVR